jgi:tRNA (cmo5U34)-methyltransferase
VYDLGAATGNVGRSLADLLTERRADLVGIEKSAAMAEKYDGPGRVVVSPVEDYIPQPYDVGVAFLTLMFIAPHRVDDLLDRWLGALRPGGVFIAVERTTPPGGYPASVFSRLTWQAKRSAGASGDDIIAKELSLSGIQRPLDPRRLTDRGAVEFFRYADFAGYMVEAP